MNSSRVIADAIDEIKGAPSRAGVRSDSGVEGKENATFPPSQGNRRILLIANSTSQLPALMLTSARGSSSESINKRRFTYYQRTTDEKIDANEQNHSIINK